MEYANYIAHCIEIARRGEYFVAPNPMVGAVLVRNSDGAILAEGWHERYGEGHAEVNCFRNYELKIKNQDAYAYQKRRAPGGKAVAEAARGITQGDDLVEAAVVEQTVRDRDPLLPGGVYQQQLGVLEVIGVAVPVAELPDRGAIEAVGVLPGPRFPLEGGVDRFAFMLNDHAHLGAFRGTQHHDRQRRGLIGSGGPDPDGDRRKQQQRQ